jgi:hypothetical protein
MKTCDYCIEGLLVREARIRGSAGICSSPVPDPRNPKWIMTRLFVVGPGEDWDKALWGPHWRATVSCPAPQKCVCDRLAPPGKQVWGNSRDEAWPHKCPGCGYHAAVVADDGVTVIKCRAHDCPHFCPPGFGTVEEYHAWRSGVLSKARC